MKVASILTIAVLLVSGCRISRTSISPPSMTTRKSEVVYDRFQVTLRTHEAMIEGIKEIALKIASQKEPVSPQQLQVLNTMLETSKGMLANLESMNNMVLMGEQSRRETLIPAVSSAIGLIMSTIAATRSR